MSTKHTPGPWFIRREPDSQRENGWMQPNYWLIEQDVGEGFGRWIATFPRLVDGEQDQQIADARLIAAAPDLLAELEKAADTFADCARTLSVLGRRTLATACEIAEQSNRAAIAKATGEPHA